MIDQSYINQYSILLTIGTINTRGRRGVPLRTSKDKEYALKISRRVIETFIGLIDGDGYISINRTSSQRNLELSLILLHGDDSEMLYYIQSLLRIGRINYYPRTNTVKYIINRTDLQEILLPLMLHHGLFFLTYRRVEQFHKLMYVLNNGIKTYSELQAAPRYQGEHMAVQDYLDLPFLDNWLVGFTIAEVSFVVKTRGDVSYQLKQRAYGHEQLFEAIKIKLTHNRSGPSKISGTKYIQLTLSSVSDLNNVIKFFSDANRHPLMGRKLVQYNK